MHKLVLVLSVLLYLAACTAASPQPAYPPPSATTCPSFPAEINMQLQPQGRGRYLIALQGLPPERPFSLRYRVQRGDFTSQQSLDALADAEGNFSRYSLSLPVPAYPQPGVTVGGPATTWHFVLTLQEGVYCLDMTMLP